MAYIGNQPSASNVNSAGIQDNSIKNVDIASDAAIDVSKLNGVTATNTELNKLDGATVTTDDLNILAGANAAGVTSTELQYLNGVTSSIQTQLDAASGASTKGTLTKTFVTGETSTIALSTASTPTASVFVTKEISQEGVTNGDWNVNANDTGYDIEDFAYAEDLSIDTTNSTATLAVSSWGADDVGKKIVGGGGEAVLLDTAGSINITNLFDSTNPTLTSGNWNFYGVEFASAAGVSLVRGDGSASTTFDFSLETVFRDSQSFNYDSNFVSGTVYRVRFNPDGTKIYLLFSNGDIHFADLTSAYDLSIDALSKGSTTLPVSAYDFAFTSNGTKLITLGVNDSTIREYTLGSAYDLTTLTAGSTFSTASQTTGTAYNFALSGDDETMLVLDTGLEQVFQYNMTTAGDVSTMSFSGNSLNVGSLSGQESTGGYVDVYGLDANPAFTEFYLMTREYENSTLTSNYVRTYKYTSTNDVGSAKIQTGSARVSDTSQAAFVIANSGRNMYTYDAAFIYKWQISTPYKLINKLSAYNNTTALANEDRVEEAAGFYNFGSSFTTYGVSASRDGSYGVYVVYDINLDDLYLIIAPLADKYRVESPITSQGSSLSISTTLSAWNGQDFHAVLSPDGTKLILSASSNPLSNPGYLQQFTMTTPYDISTSTKTSFYMGVSSTAKWDISPDGTRLYYTGKYNDSSYIGGRIYQFNLINPFDLTGKSFTANSADGFYSRTDDTRYIYSSDWTSNLPRTAGADIFGCMDNSRILIHSSYSAYTHTAMYTMSTEGDITTADIASPFDFVNDSTNAFEETAPNVYSNVFFNDTGDQVYVTIGNTPKQVNRITLPGAYQLFDYTTKYAANDNFGAYYLLGQNTVSLALKPDESRSYHLSNAGVVSEYDFGTIPHGLVGATSSGSTFSATTNETTPTCIRLNDTGTLLFVAGNSTDSVYSYIMTTAYDLSTATTTNHKSASLANEVDDLKAVVFSSDGLKLYALDGTTKSVYQYSLSSAYDLDTLTYDSKSFDLDVDTLTLTLVSDLYINPSDNEIVVLGNQIAGNGSTQMAILISYSLGTPKDVSTAFLKGYKATRRLTNYYECFAVEPTGNRAYVGNQYGVDIVSVSRNLVSASVAPTNQYLSAITNSVNQIDTEYWTDINSMSALNTISNSGNAYFAISTDNQVTFKVADNSNGIRSIVRNNAGTWEYNSNTTYGSETWTAATTNSKFRAFDEAMAVSVNKMTGSQLQGVSDNNHYTVGDTLDLAIILYQADVGTPPISDGVSINYDAAALNKGAILGTDYDYDVPSNTSVRITSLKDQNLKVKVV